MTEPGSKTGRGCLFYGSIAAGVLLLIVLLAVYFGIQYAKSLVDQFTDTKPLPLPAAVQLSPEELKQLDDRMESFRKGVQEHRRMDPLTLTADEINALIARQLGVRSAETHFHVAFTEGQVKAQISIPAERFGFRPLRGRYINGTGTFKVSLREGVLQVNPESLSSKGKPVPENIMRSMRAENFAAGFTNNPDFNAALARLQDIQIQEGKVVIVPKEPE